MDYNDFFKSITGYHPFPYQRHLGEKAWPELIEIPTGLGKTAAVIVAWIHKRLNNDSETPLRLVYCLPMRVLVEQTYDLSLKWIEAGIKYFNENNVCSPKVYLLMGGENDSEWAEHPEEPAIIIGTQDMLLSRALMRGYGMSRYQWPVHFALLHNDALWVFDEVQLMGPGLATSAQLEAFRRNFKVARPSRTIWLSATLNPRWLGTVDMQPYLEGASPLKLNSDEQELDLVKSRREAVKRLTKSSLQLTAENQKQSAKGYLETLAEDVLKKHVNGTTTLVILNTVERVQNLFTVIDRKKTGNIETILVHSRFRPQERKLLNKTLTENTIAKGAGRIIVATQAVEAGVDMTCRTLFTEIAPWPSLVQRFGRCNRYGEANECGGADIYWIDFDPDAKIDKPYEPEALAGARGKLTTLGSASASDLPAIDEDAPFSAVLRTKDFRDLFNTDPDLSGFDVDISSYIRDGNDLDIQIFWRDLSQETDNQQQPQREELCRASLGQAKVLLERLRKQELWAYRWDNLDGRWKHFSGNIRPGLILMLDINVGGYSSLFGFMASINKQVPLATKLSSEQSGETYGDDWRSRHSKAVELSRHLSDAESEAAILCRKLGLADGYKAAVMTACLWHDTGKAHAVFQATMHDCPLDEASLKTPLLAKSPSNRRHKRKYFRHELASMLLWLENANSEEDCDLVAYLIAAHHGKVRLSLRAMPDEKEPVKPLGPRFARGVWEGDVLPEIVIQERKVIPPTGIRLDLMELGEGEMGPSWTARTQKLLDAYGPFLLAWLETLVRIADWRASSAEQEEK
jgi:CRISPR-associated endonuclease/helicase Cas3